MLQTIYVLNKEILQFLGRKSMVYNQEQFQIKSKLHIAYGMLIFSALKIVTGLSNRACQTKNKQTQSNPMIF